MLDGARDARCLHNQVGARARVARVEPGTRARGHDLPTLARSDLQDLASLPDRRRLDRQRVSVVRRLKHSARVGHVLFADNVCECSPRALRVESDARPRNREQRL